MDFLTLARARHSIRAYTERDVPDDMVKTLLEAAQAAPSGGNRQPWRFFVVRDRDIIARIVERSCPQPFIATAPVLLVVCTDAARSASRYGQRGETLYCIQDTAAAIQNILLCACSLGLGTCWCGAFDEGALADVLSLDSALRPVAIIPVGWPAGEANPTRRRPIEDITTYI